MFDPAKAETSYDFSRQNGSSELGGMNRSVVHEAKPSSETCTAPLSELLVEIPDQFWNSSLAKLPSASGKRGVVRIALMYC